MIDNRRVSEQQQDPIKPVLSQSAAKRANASVRGMILALGVSVLAFVPILLLNAYPEPSVYERDIDVASVAQQAAPVAGFSPVAPDLDEGWTSNFARWNGGSVSGVPYWEVGYVTAEEEFLSLSQTSESNPTWLSQQTDGAPAVGMREIAGTDWEIRHRPGVERSLVLQSDGTTISISGTASDEEFDVLAASVTEALESAPAPPVSSPPSSPEAP